MSEGNVKYMFRVETTDDRVGVYCSDGDYAAFGNLDREKTLERHPCPVDDAGLYEHWSRMTYDEQEDMLFGFNDIEQYLAWFCCPKGRAEIKDDYHLAVYAVHEDHYYPGTCQVVADRSHMIHITDLPTTTTEYSAYVNR